MPWILPSPAGGESGDRGWLVQMRGQAEVDGLDGFVGEGCVEGLEFFEAGEIEGFAGAVEVALNGAEVAR